MVKLSGCILTKNNDRTIRYALESIHKYVDEIIIIDSGSKDKTLDIVSQYTKKIYFNEFKDFSAQRNFAVSKWTGDWVFMLDADEVVGENFPRVIKLLHKVSDKFRTIILARYNLVNINPLTYVTTSPVYQDWQYGFIKNDGNIVYDDQPVHAQMINFRPRLKCGFGHIFHLDFLVKNYEMRKKKFDFYETKQTGGGHPKVYLFENYPYRTARTIEKLDANIYKMLLEDKNFFSYEERSNQALQIYQSLKYSCHEFLTYAKGFMKPKY